MNAPGHPIPFVRPAEALPEAVILPPSGTEPLRPGELWSRRDLLRILVWRDLAVRFKQTAAGAAWVLLQPLLGMLVLTLVFGRFAGVPSAGRPYPVFAYAALVPWTYFVHALTVATTSLVNHSEMVTKISFPRLLLPTAGVLAGLLDMAIATVLLGLLMAFYRVAPGPALLAFPFFLLLLVGAALGIGLLLATLNVRYRDVNNALPFVTQILFFLTPVGYGTDLVPAPWRTAYFLNPLAGVIEGFRWSLLDTAPPPILSLLVSTLMTVLLLAGGLAYFRRHEHRFADVI